MTVADRQPLDLPPLADLAARGGMTGGRSGWTPCPLCGAERRGREDRRGPVALFPGRAGERWACHACNRGGDAVDLAAALRWGEIPPRTDRDRWAELFTELRGGPSLSPRVTPGARERSPAGSGGGVSPKTRALPPEPEGPQPADLAAFWRACRPLTAVRSSDPARAWLTSWRGLDAADLAALDLVRLVPAEPPPGGWPRWIPRLGLDLGRWLDVYRLVVPMWNARGLVRSLRFRAVDRVLEGLPEPGPGGELTRWRAVEVPGNRKALAPVGGRLRGLVLADPLGLALLRRRPEDDGPVVADGVSWDGRIVVTEGEPDAWTWASAQRRRAWALPAPEGAPLTSWAVLGVVAGSFPAGDPAAAELAARIPDGARVGIRTHPDDAGRKYAAAILDSLRERARAGRVTVHTWTPPEGGSDGDHA